MSTLDPNEYPAAKLLADRIRHALVFQEAAVRSLREALELLEKESDQEGGDQ